MCGICGYIGDTGCDRAQIRRMADRMAHRGPDSSGYFEEPGIHMGFRRLAIIDLQSGNQPVYNEDRSLVLTFNGEIYNYRELRKILLARGHFFYTESDSEVLVHAYEEWGENMLRRLRGMFAFCIYDRREKGLFLARDFFGIKPLHYMECGGHFVYGSEIKSLLEFSGFQRQLNERTLERYLSFQYPVPPETFYRGIFCLPPAHGMRYRNGTLHIRRYWEPVFCPDEAMPLTEAADRIEAAFEDSVKAHRVSDVEVGCFLSSGVDSSWAASYFSGQKAFTVGFAEDSRCNEIDWAQKTAAEKNLEHTARIISGDEFFESLPAVQYYMDQPLADPACVALYFVSELASRQVKVVLSGEGADELFGGYRIYHMPDSNAGYQRLLPSGLRKFLGRAAGFLPDLPGRDFLIRAGRPLEESFIGNASMFTRQEKQKILRNPELAEDPWKLCRPYYRRSAGLDDVTRMQYLDLNLWMVGDILLKADRMSMAHSLELRVPFLDLEVFRAAASIPKKWKVTDAATKYAMRAAAERRLSQTTAEKPKLGFPVPIRTWLREEQYYRMVREEFTGPAAREFFRIPEILRLLDRHYRRKEDAGRKIWTIYMFLLWYRTCFEKNTGKPV